jgi:hypothetical protein
MRTPKRGTDRDADEPSDVGVSKKQATDEDLAMEFLAGYVYQEPDGKVSYKYDEPGSDGERTAKVALVRLLRNGSPLSNIIRWRLAALFDPDHTAEARELHIKPRSRHGAKPPQYVRDVEIARIIAAEVNANGKIEAAKAFVMKRYGVKESTVDRAWRKHGKAWLLRQDPSNIN